MPNPGMSTTGNAQVCMYFSVAVLHSLRHPTNDTTDHEYQSKSCLYFGLIVVTDMSAAMQERGDGTWTCVLCASMAQVNSCHVRQSAEHVMPATLKRMLGTELGILHTSAAEQLRSSAAPWSQGTK